MGVKNRSGVVCEAAALLAALIFVDGTTAIGQPILSSHSHSRTDYHAPASAVQGVRPGFLQRGVHLDGTEKEPSHFGWLIAGSPFSEELNLNLQLDKVRLDSGAYVIEDVDLSLPAKGIRWAIGRTYNPLQITTESATLDSNGYQGRNWFQSSQPELILVDDEDDSKDMVYLVYGADRYLEFVRVIVDEVATSTYRGVNGVAGAVVFNEDMGGADTFTYFDAHGNKVTFFGFDTAAAPVAGQLWTMVDTAGNTTYVGHATNKAQAVSDGYDSAGRLELAFDASGNRYTYGYSTFDGVSRLTQVVAEQFSGSAWAEVARVEYTYYVSTDADIANGSPGDLKLVNVITPTSDSAKPLSERHYYRYWKGEWDEEEEHYGQSHRLKYVFTQEGTRRLDWDGTISAAGAMDTDFLTATDNAVKGYASAYLEYDSQSRLRAAWFDGECGCSGGVVGEYKFRYESGSYQGTATRRTTAIPPVVFDPLGGGGQQPGAYITQYFDESGQPLSKVLTNGDPSVPEEVISTWSMYVERDTDGVITRIHVPKNVSTYTHSTGSFGLLPNDGLVVRYERVASGDLKGFISGRLWMQGDSATTEYYDWSATYTSSTLAASTDYTLTRPFFASRTEYSTLSNTTGANTTNFDYTFHAGSASLIPKKLETKAPIVGVSSNGPGGTARDTTIEYFRADETRAFLRDRDGVLAYQRMEEGLLMAEVADVNTSATQIATADNPSAGWGIGSVTNGLSIATTHAYDPRGRLTSSTHPDGRVVRNYYSRLKDGRGITLVIPREQSATGPWNGPVKYQVFNGLNRLEVDATVALTGGEVSAALSGWIVSDSSNATADPILAVSSSVGTVESLTTNQFNKTGSRVETNRKYTTIPSSGAGSSGTNFDVTTLEYDGMGRRARVTPPSGTIVRTTFDARGLPNGMLSGTDDSGVTLSPSDMVQVWSSAHDGGGSNSGTGSGELSESQCAQIYVSFGPGPSTKIYRDLQGRALLIQRVVPPHTFFERDNQGRITAAGTYDNVSELVTGDAYLNPSNTPRTFNGSTSHRLSLNEFFYDEQGREYRRVWHNISQSGLDRGDSLDSIESHAWHDASGRIIKLHGNQLLKRRYDRVGRLTHEFELASSDDTGYSDALTLTGDIVLSERQIVRDSFVGNILLDVQIDRFHDDDHAATSHTTGPLDLNADGGTPDPMKVTAADVLGRARITATWYDYLNRPTTVAYYGTNGGATFNRTGLTEPTVSTSSLSLTKKSYRYDGRLQERKDPAGHSERYEYDDAGRQVKVIENYVDGTVGPGDEDRVVEFEYERGFLKKRRVKVYGASDQVTEYTRGTSLETATVGNKLASGHLLSQIKLPDGNAGTGDVITLKYDVRGKVAYVTDQAGNVIHLEYDEAGRRTTREVTTFASGFSNSVKSIEYAYTSRGEIGSVTQLDSSSITLDSVTFEYDGWGALTKLRQDHDSTPGGTHLYDVQYFYEKSPVESVETRRVIRRTETRMPDNTPIKFDYMIGSGMTLDDASIINGYASRVSRVKLGSSETPVAKYQYLGHSGVVGTYYPEPDLTSNLYGTTPHDYAALDDLNRRIDDTWTKTGAGTIHELSLTYDLNSNVTRVLDAALPTRDIEYTLDDLDRVVRATEGSWSGSAIASPKHDEQWTLSQAGNWLGHKLDNDGDGVFAEVGDLDETSTFNVVNETQSRDLYSDTTTVVTPQFDAVGNLKDDGQSYEYVFDPFGRLRKVLDRTNTSKVVAEYQYNGLGQMISAQYDTNSDGSLSGEPMERYVYDAAWRLLSVYVTTTGGTALKERYVAHYAGPDGMGGSSYIDSYILRDRDAAGDPSLESRIYYCQNWRTDVATVTDETGRVLERVRYSAYGVPKVFYPANADFNNDGDIGTDADIEAFFACLAGDCCPTCDDGDTNGDGDTFTDADIEDFFLALAGGNRAYPGLSLSSENRIGYGGYMWDKVVRVYHTRNRVYSPSLGRFLSRDPLRYAGGSNNLYEYVGSMAISMVDPSGLFGVMVMGDGPIDAIKDWWRDTKDGAGGVIEWWTDNPSWEKYKQDAGDKGAIEEVQDTCDTICRWVPGADKVLGPVSGVLLEAWKQYTNDGDYTECLFNLACELTPGGKKKPGKNPSGPSVTKPVVSPGDGGNRPHKPGGGGGGKPPNAPAHPSGPPNQPPKTDPAKSPAPKVKHPKEYDPATPSEKFESIEERQRRDRSKKPRKDEDGKPGDQAIDDISKSRQRDKRALQDEADECIDRLNNPDSEGDEE